MDKKDYTNKIDSLVNDKDIHTNHWNVTLHQNSNED